MTEQPRVIFQIDAAAEPVGSVVEVLAALLVAMDQRRRGRENSETPVACMEEKPQEGVT